MEIYSIMPEKVWIVQAGAIKAVKAAVIRL
jgi:hypothetical protein